MRMQVFAAQTFRAVKDMLPQYVSHHQKPVLTGPRR
jgi:hypothetical protein